MPYFLNKMENKISIKFEDILFWILILAAVAVIIWKLHGSPTDTGAIVGIGTFLISSEALIWKRIFKIEKDFNNNFSKMDKNITVSFMKLRNDFDKNNLIINNRFDKNNIMMNNRFDKIEDKLNLINNKLKK